MNGSCAAPISPASPVGLDLSEAAGAIPVEMLGYLKFPPIDRHAYRLTLAPYSFSWFELQQKHQPAEVNYGFRR